MSISCKFSVTDNRKPTNIFYIWYAELCRRSNSSPLTAVKPAKLKNDTVLDFTADRIKPEEWTPILNALRLDTSLHAIAIRSRVAGCRFLYEANTEERVRRMNRRCGCLWTDYIISSLSRSLGSCLKNSEVLSTLELDGLPIAEPYLELLFQSLRNNRTLKALSLKRCPINDRGCQQLCTILRAMPNIQVLNLSACNLGNISGQFISEIIQHQQLQRYCESWHQSLRYEQPEVANMAGLKRITLNDNPDLGDEGLSYILDKLMDDLWIKAIDMQKCNITENMSFRIIEIVEKNQSLEVADFRNNDRLSFATMERILEALRKKYRIGHEPEYQWCCTTTTLTDFTASYSDINGVTAILQKSRSAPLKQTEPLQNGVKPYIRRTNTLTVIEGKPTHRNGFKELNKRQLIEAKKQFSLALNNKLHEDITKKKHKEKSNHKYEYISESKYNRNVDNIDTSSELIKIFNNMKLDAPRNKGPAKVANEKGINNMVKSTVAENSDAVKRFIFNRLMIASKPSNPIIPDKMESSFEKKQSNIETSVAQTIFQKFLSKDNQNFRDGEETDDDYFSYYDDDDDESEDNLQWPVVETNVNQNLYLHEEDLKLQLDTSESSDEISLSSPREKAQSYFSKIMLEAG